MEREDAEKLFLANSKLVYFVLKKQYPYLQFDEDMQQEGMIGLWKACLTFNSDKGKFSTYACKVIYNSFRIVLRKKAKFDTSINVVSLEEPMEDKGVTTLAALIQTPLDCIDNIDTRINIDSAMASLSEREQTAVKCILAGYTQKQTAKFVQRSQPFVSRSCTKFKNNLEAMNENR